MKILTLGILIAGVLFQPYICKAQDREIISKKSTTILANLLASEEPANFAKAHGIELKDGMIKVVMCVDKNFSLNTLELKYDLKNLKQRKNIITADISIKDLRELCKEPSVIFMRLPAKFIGKGKRRD